MLHFPQMKTPTRWSRSSTRLSGRLSVRQPTCYRSGASSTFRCDAHPPVMWLAGLRACLADTHQCVPGAFTADDESAVIEWGQSPISADRAPRLHGARVSVDSRQSNPHSRPAAAELEFRHRNMAMGYGRIRMISCVGPGHQDDSLRRPRPRAGP